MAGGLCDYCVSPSPSIWVLGIFRLGQTLRSGLGECWDGELRLRLGLDKNLDLRLRTNVLVN